MTANRDQKRRVDYALQRTVFSIEIPTPGHVEGVLDGEIDLRVGVPNNLLLIWMASLWARELCIVTSTNPHGQQTDVAVNWERWAALTSCIAGHFDTLDGAYSPGPTWFICHSKWMDGIVERSEIHAAVINMDKEWATKLCERFEQDSFLYVHKDDGVPQLILVGGS